MKRKDVIGDIVLITAALLTAVLLFVIPLIFQNDGEMLTVTVKTENGERTESYSLDDDREFTVENNGVTLTVTVRDRKAYVSESDCDNRFCVNSGSISRTGQSIVCVPAGVYLTVTGGDSDVDAVAK